MKTQKLASYNSLIVLDLSLWERKLLNAVGFKT